MPIIVAGNTVEGEEGVIIEAWKKAKERFPTVRLILTPRQPKRFDLVASYLDSIDAPYQRATKAWAQGHTHLHDTQILLLDTMGELASVYGLGHLALVGGGWCWHGGHNPLEPLFWGLPTLIGPGYTNFEDLVIPLLDAKCLSVVSTQDIADSICRSLSRIDPNTHSKKPIKIPECLQGCLQRTWEHLMPALRG
jgi:3-deoxy-D-manno-octulosonic-acid transferase